MAAGAPATSLSSDLTDADVDAETGKPGRVQLLTIGPILTIVKDAKIKPGEVVPSANARGSVLTTEARKNARLLPIHQAQLSALSKKRIGFLLNFNVPKLPERDRQESLVA